MTWLLNNSLLDHPGLRTRVLLVAHGTDGLPQLRASLDAAQADLSSQHVTG